MGGIGLEGTLFSCGTAAALSVLSSISDNGARAELHKGTHRIGRCPYKIFPVALSLLHRSMFSQILNVTDAKRWYKNYYPTEIFIFSFNYIFQK